MDNAIDGTKVAAHGMFYMESAGGCPPERPVLMPEERTPSCFALEEEKGEHWTGVGADKPIIKETRPRL